MQSIYAFKQNEESVYHLGVDFIRDKFYEYLLEIGKTEERMVRKEEEAAIRLFAQIRSGDRQTIDDAGASVKVKEVVAAAFSIYRSRRNHDNLSFGKQMLDEVELLYQRYLEMMQAIVFFVKEGDIPSLQGNQAVEMLTQYPLAWEAFQKAGLPAETLTRWLRLLKKDETVLKTLESFPAQDLEGDKDRIRTILREFLFKNEIISSIFEEDDINWTENKGILRGMVNNTLKNLDDGTVGETSDEILSKNWEEDKAFFVQLYKLYFSKELEYEVWIADKTKKWAPDRIATIDRILMMMAMCEMMNFSSIPVKVTINEYIEISKSYSTPKSWQFINGMLDEISRSLMNAGEIKKSGRGLIDNK